MTHKSRTASPEDGRSLSRAVTRNGIGLTLGGIAVLMLAWGAVTYVSYARLADGLEENAIQDYRTSLRNEVHKLVEEIKLEESFERQSLRRLLEGKVDQAHAAVAAIYEANADLEEEDRKKVCSETLRQLRWDDGNGYYFVLNTDDVLVLHPLEPELEGNEMTHVFEGDVSLPSELSTILRSGGRGFIEYTWHTADGAEKTKISFARAFYPLDWIICTGSFTDTITRAAQDRIERRVAAETFDDGRGYLFVISGGGLRNADRWGGDEDPLSVQGRLPVTDQDPDPTAAVQSIVKAARHPGGGFVDLPGAHPDGKESVRNLLFTVPYEEWNWVLGAGVSLDDVDLLVAQARERLTQRLTSQLTVCAGLGTCLLCLSAFMWSRLNRATAREFSRFAGFYRQAIRHGECIEVDGFQFYEFRELGRAANRMLAARNAAEDAWRRIANEQRLLLDTLDTHIWHMRDEATYGTVNSASARFVGKQPAEMEGCSVRDLHPAEEAEAAILANRKVIKSRKTERHEVWRTNAAGQRRLLAVTRTPALDDEGAVQYIVCSAIDITSRHQASVALTARQKELEQRTAELEESRRVTLSIMEDGDAARVAAEQALANTEALIDAVPVAVIVIGRGNTVLRANRAAFRLVGVALPNALDESVAPAWSGPPPVEACPVAGAGAIQEPGERILIRRDGREVPVIKTSVPFIFNGEDALLEVFVDFSERKDAENRLRESNARVREALKRERESARQLAAAMDELRHAKLAAEAATKAKGEFIANMSHELRTPLTAILGYADILSEASAKAAAAEGRADYLDTIRRNGEHLLAIINDILDISKIDAGKVTIENIRCSPAQIVDEVRDLMRVRADEKNLPIHIEFATPVPDAIQSDPTRIKQILVNLIGNAIKFTQTGEVRLTLHYQDPRTDDTAEKAQTASPAEGDAILRFEVSDTGIGMSPEQMRALFQPFTQADASTTRMFGGTGLGLTISKRLAQMLDGDIAVESRLGQGSTFRLELICKHPSQERVSTIGAAVAPVASVECRKLLPEGCRVLLAEDGPDNQHLIDHILTDAGANVTIVDNGRAAMDLALAARESGRQFHVILMDMQMPIMDGYAATSSLRDLGYDGAVIALTANAMEQDRQKCLAAGCDEYASKPINRAKLIAAINDLLVRAPQLVSSRD